MNTHSQPSSISKPGFPRQNYTNKSILIIETSGCLAIPLTYFPTRYKLHSALNIKEAQQILESQKIDLIAFNVSCPEETTYELLEMIHVVQKDSITPLLLVIDLSQPLTSIPGTTWGDRLGILHSISSRGEFIATLLRLFDDKL